MVRPCRVLFDNNIIPKLIGAESESHLRLLMKSLWDRFPESRIDEKSISLSAIVTPSVVIESLDLPKVLFSTPNYEIDLRQRMIDFRQRCVQEHFALLPDNELDSRIKKWLTALPNTLIKMLIGEPFFEFCSSGAHSGLIREYLALHRLLSYPYLQEVNQAHSFLLVECIQALRADSFVPFLRLARAIATALGQTTEGKKKGWYNNPEIRLSLQADHLDTELLQVALFGAGKNQANCTVCVTNDPANKVRARIHLIMQILVEYEGWAKERNGLESAPMPMPGYVVFPNQDFSKIEEIIDVQAEIKTYLMDDKN